MAQQNIDFGSFPDDPNADAIRTAFQKVQDNFDEVYATTIVGTVTSVNRGAGITVNSPTGNVIVTANIACVQVATSSLSMGVGANGGTGGTITQSTQTLVIDINPANVFSANFSGVSGALANINGTLTSNSNSQPNITSVGTLTSLAVTGNVTAGNVYANSGTIGATTLIGTLNGNSNSQPNITTIGTLGNLNVTSNSNLGNLATANFFSGDGYLLSNLTISAGSSIINGNSNVVVGANGNVTTSVAGNSNILTVTGTGANVAGYLTATGNVTGANASLGNAVTANYFIGNLYGQANTAVTAGTVTTAAQPNITSVGTLSALTVTANITAGNVHANSGIVSGQYLYGDGSNITNITITAGSSILNGTSNVSIPTLNGNVNTVVAGNTTLVVTGTGVNIAGTLNATSTITGNFNGNVTNATQSNITTLGTLTGLNVSGTSNLGPVGNVTITGGSANAFLMTNGSGALTWNNGTLLPVQGSNSQVIFNDGGTTYAGNASLTFNKTTGALTATSLAGNLTTSTQSNITEVGTLKYLIVGTASGGSGNLNAVNITTTGVYAGSGANLTNLPAGNISGQVSNSLVAGTVYTNAQPNITSVGTLTSMTSSGNVQGANVISTGYNIRSVGISISAAGTVQGNATVLTKEFNGVASVASGAGVVLPTAVAGMAITIVNSSANSLLVYPASGAAINSLTTNTGYTQSTLATLQYIALSTTQWYTVGATYA